MLHFSLSLMNRLNQIESAIFIPLLWFCFSQGIDILPEFSYGGYQGIFFVIQVPIHDKQRMTPK